MIHGSDIEQRLDRALHLRDRLPNSGDCAGPRFGVLLKQRRRERNLTLREFAARAGIDPGNLSKIERGRLDPPQDRGLLDRLCRALGYDLEDAHAKELRDLAAVEAGRIPHDILSNEAAMTRMPVLMRTVHERNLTGTEIDTIIEMIRAA
jgi:transcriptional regulator with XRE-family HTH domain